MPTGSNIKKIPVTLIFDIGKTNKKALLFDDNLNLIYSEEKKFAETVDDDGFPCDDFNNIEQWIADEVKTLMHSDEYNVTHINFATYGATLVYLDADGKRLTPVYNYLKPLNSNLDEEIYKKWNGKNEFLRKTASPPLKMLNSGFQILNLKYHKPEVYKQVKHILHLPQYLSYLFTNQIKSEITSIGCHTALWDFDNMCYHDWLNDENFILPEPNDLSLPLNKAIEGKAIETGIGIHDSSSSLVPYLKGSEEPFLLISTGTWCINMNPFNNEPLTADELQNDCLLYMSYQQKPVKSSRVFLGHLFNLNIKRISEFFSVDENHFKTLDLNIQLIKQTIRKSKKQRYFLSEGLSSSLVDEQADINLFIDFEHAYTQLIVDLTLMVFDSINFIITDQIKRIYITGGFARNQHFVRTLATLFNQFKVYISEIDNATSLGAALVINKKINSNINLGLTPVKAL